MTGRLGTVVVLGALLMAGCGGAAHTSGSGTSANGTALNARILSSPAQLAQIETRQPTVLLFIATGCVSCLAEVNGLREAIGSHPGIQAVGIDTVAADSTHDLGSFLEAQGVADAPLLWVIDRDGSLASRYSVAALGATVGIDRTGAVRFVNPGPSDAARLAAQLAMLTT